MRTLRVYLIVTIILFGFASNIFSKNILFGLSYLKSINNSNIPNFSGYQSKLIYQAQEKIAIGITFGCTSTISNEDIDFQYVSSGIYTFDYLTSNNFQLLPGDFSMHWFEIAPIIYLIQDYTKHNISIYCGGGFGLYYPKNKWNWNTYRSLQKSRDEYGIRYYEDDINSKLGYNAQIGISIPITHNSKINFEGKYLYYKPKLTYEVQTPESDYAFNGSRKIDLSSFSYSISLMLNL